MKNKNKKTVFALSILLLLMIVYLLPILNNSHDKFAKNSFVNNVDVSGLTAEEANQKLSSNNANEFKIKKRDGKEETFKLGSAITVTDQTEALVKLIENQNILNWPARFFGKKDNYSVSYNYDINFEEIDKNVAGLNMIVNPTIQDPQNAYVEKTDTGFQVVKEVAGNRVELEKLQNLVRESLKSGSFSIDLEDKDIYKKPEIRSDSPEILAELEGYKKFEEISLNIDFVGATEQLTFHQLKDYLSFDAEGNIKFNDEEMINSFKNYAQKYNTFGKVRDFNATGIGTVKVGGTSVDSYGFQLDTIKTVEAVKEAIVNNQKKIKAIWKIPALVRTEEGDIGNTYVEIDLTRQHLWYYVNGELKLETDIVSGKDSSPTPVGLNRVWHKEKNKTLVGPGYRQPVSYWMPFNWVDCGMHDTNYRKAFGGQIYHRNGSHGCINMPPAKAKQLYEMIKYDTPVIVYKSGN